MGKLFAAVGQNLGTLGAEGAAQTRQTGTVLGAKGLAVHVCDNLIHPQAKLCHRLLRPGASEVVVGEAANVVNR